MNNADLCDGIHGMLPREKMTESAIKLRDIYACVPNAPLFHREFGFYSFDRWHSEGHISTKEGQWDPTDYTKKLFGLDEPGNCNVGNLSWTTAAFYPEFESIVIEDRGEHEVVQDHAGRKVLFFKNKREGFMPEYLDHPVKDMKSWEENCKWRMDPNTPERKKAIADSIPSYIESAKKGIIMTQRLVGGYMYLRSLFGPEALLYTFYDEPELIHDCMKTWLELSDAVIAEHQKHISLDELYLSEDICFNVSSLISPDHMREFLLPYYQQLITNIKARQKDKNRHLYIQIDTDGHIESVIDIYKEIGAQIMSPFEVASGCDVVKIGAKYPDLIMFGGIDKRILAESKEAINRHIDYILPPLLKRGGYIPTCDHGVPPEVSFENYMHYRKRCLEYSK